MPDCWLEVSLHPEVPATGQHDQGFSVVFFSPRENAEFVGNFTLTASFTRKPPNVNIKISS
jgi:hypothetical protein